MAFQVANNLRFRRSFGRIKKIIDLPYLIEIQKNSYDQFLQREVAPAQRQNFGLQEVFKSVFPIKDFNETASLEFVSYALGEPKYDVEECHQRGMTFRCAVKSDSAACPVGRRRADRCPQHQKCERTGSLLW